MPDPFPWASFWAALAAIAAVVAAIAAVVAIVQAMSARSSAKEAAIDGAKAAAKFDADHTRWIASREYLIGLHDLALYWHSMWKDAGGFFIGVVNGFYDDSNIRTEIERTKEQEIYAKRAEWAAYLKKSWIHITAVELASIMAPWETISTYLPPNKNGKLPIETHLQHADALLGAIKKIMIARKMHGESIDAVP